MHMHAWYLQIYLCTALDKFESLDAMTSSVDHKPYLSTLDNILKFESLVATETDNACIYIKLDVLKFESLACFCSQLYQEPIKKSG